jgi:putative spermidine/putrescine transport system permease protein
LRRAWTNPGLLLSAPAQLLLLVFFVAPLALLLPTSLHSFDPSSGIGGDWTLENYAAILSDSFYVEILARTIGLGLLVSLICLIVGWPMASLIARSQSRYKYILVLIVIFPLLIDVVVRSFGWIVLLSDHGIVNDFLVAIGVVSHPVKLIFNFTGLVIGMVHLMLPFMILILSSAIQAIPRDLENASATLGSHPAATFFFVTVPLAMPGIVAGSTLVFVLTISSMVTPRLLGGPTYRVMATAIYDEFLQLLNWPMGAALSSTLTVLVLVLVVVSGRLAQRWAPR